MNVCPNSRLGFKTSSLRMSDRDMTPMTRSSLSTTTNRWTCSAESKPVSSEMKRSNSEMKRKTKDVWKGHYLGTDDLLHDGEERIVQVALLDALEPRVAVLVGLPQRNVQVVVRLFCRQVLVISWPKQNSRLMAGSVIHVLHPLPLLFYHYPTTIRCDSDIS